MSDQMDTLFIPILHIALRVKGATFRTILELVRDPLCYPEAFEKIPHDAKQFILNDYKDSFYQQTKSAIITRLSRLTVDTSLGVLFTTSTNSVDLSTALDQGKIVLVHTDAEFLQENSAIFGKYFIAQAYNAGLARGSRQGVQRRPIYIYIDECAPYLDSKLEKMLTTIRSYGVGVLMAFQGAWQFPGYERVIQGNTSIKLLGHLRDNEDARVFAGNMKTSVEFLMSQRKDNRNPPQYGTFACFTTDLNRTISLQLPFYQLDHRPLMSEPDYRRMRRNNRERLQQSSDERRQNPNDQYTFVLKFWPKFEEAVANAGGWREDINRMDLNRLYGKLTLDELKIAHRIREQRNRLSHRSPVDIPDPLWWKENIEHLIAVLNASGSSSEPPTSSQTGLPVPSPNEPENRPPKQW